MRKQPGIPKVHVSQLPFHMPCVTNRYQAYSYNGNRLAWSDLQNNRLIKEKAERVVMAAKLPSTTGVTNQPCVQ